MADRICWQEGDEYRCKRCGAWHGTVIAHPDETRYAMNIELIFVCPLSVAGAYFWCNRVGEPVYELDRWRRGPSELEPA